AVATTSRPMDRDALTSTTSPGRLGASHEGSWGNESTWVPDPQAAIDLLREEIRPGDVVLVKASRSIGLDVVATALLEEPS
ncbi:MAG: hypothetical protein ACKOFP_13665, partial [Actinomycetota bacterium]